MSYIARCTIFKNFKKQRNTQDQKQWPETSAEQVSSCPAVVADAGHHMMQTAIASTLTASSQIWISTSA